MYYKNITGESSVTSSLSKQNLLIDGRIVRPYEKIHFDKPTSDIIKEMNRGRIRVYSGDYFVREPAEFEGWTIEKKEKSHRIQTVDGAQVRTEVYYTVSRETSEEESSPEVSTSEPNKEYPNSYEDYSAKEAIDLIEEGEIDDVELFCRDETRVTVLRAADLDNE